MHAGGPTKGADAIGPEVFVIHSLSDANAPVISGDTELDDFCAAQDCKTCAICNKSLAKRRLQLRHHCRVCKRVVCGSCSPGVIPLSGLCGTHRICMHCAEDCENMPAMRKEMHHLVDRLRSLSGEGPRSPGVGIFEECVLHSKSIATHIRGLHMDAANEGLARQRMEAESVTVQAKVLRIYSILEKVVGDDRFAGGASRNLTETLDSLTELAEAIAAAGPVDVQRTIATQQADNAPTMEAKQSSVVSRYSSFDIEPLPLSQSGRSNGHKEVLIRISWFRALAGICCGGSYGKQQGSWKQRWEVCWGTLAQAQSLQ